MLIRYALVFLLFIAFAYGINVQQTNNNLVILNVEEKSGSPHTTGSDHGMHDGSSTGTGETFGEKSGSPHTTGSDHGMHDSSSTGAGETFGEKSGSPHTTGSDHGMHDGSSTGTGETFGKLMNGGQKVEKRSTKTKNLTIYH